MRTVYRVAGQTGMRLGDLLGLRWRDVAGLLRAQGELAAAGPLFERAVEISERVLRPDHPDTARVRSNLPAITS